MIDFRNMTAEDIVSAKMKISKRLEEGVTLVNKDGIREAVEVFTQTFIQKHGSVNGDSVESLIQEALRGRND